MKQIKTKEQLIKEIKKSIRECKDSIESNQAILDFFGSMFEGQWIEEIVKSNKQNKYALKFMKECLRKVEAGELDYKFAKEEDLIDL